MRKIVGHVTTKEKEEIRKLHIRERSLSELVIAIDDNKIDFGEIEEIR